MSDSPTAGGGGASMTGITAPTLSGAQIFQPETMAEEATPDESKNACTKRIGSNEYDAKRLWDPKVHEWGRRLINFQNPDGR
jgi:hypothetical protein